MVRYRIMKGLLVSLMFYIGMFFDNIKGLVLVLFFSFFIGVSFIIKKKGLKRVGVIGVRVGIFGFFFLWVF